MEEQSNPFRGFNPILLQFLFAELLPGFVRALVVQGIFTESDADNLDSLELMSKLVSYSSVSTSSFRAAADIHESFLEKAIEAANSDEKEIAILLFSTACEQTINSYYRDLFIVKGLSECEATQAIRNSSIEAKLSWLLKLIDPSFEISIELVKKIKKFSEVRNSIVHYKAEPYFLDTFVSGREKIKMEISRIDLNEFAIIHEQLENELDSFLNIVDPHAPVFSKIMSNLSSDMGRLNHIEIWNRIQSD